MAEDPPHVVADDVLTAERDIGEELEAEARARAASLQQQGTATVTLSLEPSVIQQRRRREWIRLALYTFPCFLLSALISNVIVSALVGHPTSLVSSLVNAMTIPISCAMARVFVEGYRLRRKYGPILELTPDGLRANTPYHDNGFLAWKDMRAIAIKQSFKERHIRINTAYGKQILVTSTYLPMEADALVAQITAYKEMYES